MKLISAILALAFLSVTAQAIPLPKTPKNAMLAQWNDISRKLVAMAADMPEDKYDYQPNPQVRTFAQVLLHVAFWNQYVAKTAKGERADDKLNELPRASYPKKADVVKVLQSSFQDATRALMAETDEEFLKHMELWSAFLEHSGEHYGQLVVYYRLNGLVPPESRKQ